MTKRDPYFIGKKSVAAVSLILAALAWYVITGREKVDAWIEMTIELTGATEELEIRGGPPGVVDVRVRGPRLLVRSLAQQTPVYSLDIGDLTEGENIIVFDPLSIPMPKALEVVEISPSRLEVMVDRLVTVELPVEPLVRADPGRLLEIASITAQPSKVSLRGPDFSVLGLNGTQTRPAVVNATEPGTYSVVVDVDAPLGMAATPAKVRVDVVIRDRMEEVWLKLQLMEPPPRSNRRQLDLKVKQVKPPEIQIHVRAPLRSLEGGGAEGIKDGSRATLQLPDFVDEKSFVTGYDLVLPSGVELLKAVPQKVDVFLE